MQPKIIAVVVLMIVLVGCERYSDDNKAITGMGNNVFSSNTQVTATPESKPENTAPTAATTPLSTPQTTAPSQMTEPIAEPTAIAKYSIKEHVIYSGVRNKEKKVALTFDDGPDTKYTDQILDILKKQKVNATFFVVGDHASAHKDVMKRIVNNGHELGNHSWNHMDLTKIDEPKLEEEIDTTDEIIKSFSGHPTNLLRPPYGALSKQVIDYTEKSHKIICWSVDTRDWEGISADQILENVKKEVHPGAIILQHSAGGKNGNLSTTIKALPQIIAYLQENGYTLVTVSNLIQ